MNRSKPIFLKSEDTKDIQQGRYNGEAAMVMLINKRGEILLNLRDNKPNILYPAHWAILGGGVEQGETPLQAARREIQEEIGHAIKGPIKEFAKIIDRNGKGHLVTIFVTSIDKAINELELREGKALKFFPKKQLPELKITPFLKEVILAYFFRKPLLRKQRTKTRVQISRATNKRAIRFQKKRR